MKKTFVKLGLLSGLFLAMAVMAPMASAQEGSSFEFHGYARAGVNTGLNLSEQGSVDTEWIGRLGNEAADSNNDFYNESEFVYKTVAEDGAWAKYHALFAVNNQNLFTDNGASQGSWALGQNGSMSPYMREAFTEMGGFSWDPKAVYWIGMKYVERDDVMTEDYYWRNFSGTGFGMTNGLNGVLDVNFTTNASTFNSKSSDGYQYLPFDTDVRVRPFGALGVAALTGLELEANVYYENKNDGTAPAGKTYSDWGPQFAAVYNFDKFFYFANGFSKVVLQVATQNAATDWNLGNNNGDNNGNTAAGGDETKGLAYRVIVFGAGMDLIPHLDVMPSFTYEWIKGTNPGEDDASRLSVVVRPVYKFTPNLSLQVEGGYSYIFGTNSSAWWGSNATGFSGGEEKLTIAPTLSLNSGLFGRPELELFYTVINKDKSINGGYLDSINNNTYIQKMGVQMETWF